jgi:serralysin
MSTYYGTSGKNVVNESHYFNLNNIFTYAGDDIIKLNVVGSGGGNNYVQAGAGNDTVTNAFEGWNTIYLGSGNDTYDGNGFSRGRMHDAVYGGSGKDTFNVHTTHSDYYGGSGDDTFNSIGLNNRFDGGDGRNTVSYMLQDSDPVLNGQGVYVNLNRGVADTGNQRHERLFNIQDAVGTSHADTLDGSGQKNDLYGMSGNDVLNGQTSNDKLFGGNGNDDLYGGVGNDKLTGGLGKDLMWGNDGTDTFIFASLNDSVTGSNRDVIKDFSHSEGDRIDVSGIDAISGGNNNSFDYIGSAGFSHTAGELRFSNHTLYGDVNGDGHADFSVHVSGVSHLSQSDFIL